jgi:uncharacterized protein (DUF433 family)
MANWKRRIHRDPGILGGKPVIKGTRIAVAFVLELLAHGWTHEQILDDYPNLKNADLLACLAYAADRANSDRTIAISA